MNSENVNHWPLFLRKMTSPEIAEAVTTAKIAILVVGSIEQHGSHLPIDTDLATAEYLVEKGLIKARETLSQPIAYIAPSIPYGGPGLGMDEWPGTLFLRPSVLIDVVSDICGRLVESGFRYILVVNGCVGNIPTLMLAVKQIKNCIPEADFILADSAWMTPEISNTIRESAPGEMGHADEFETSIGLVLDPDHVYMDKAVREVMRHPSSKVSWDYLASNPFFWPEQFGKMTKSGVLGNATFGTAEKGETILKANIERIASILCHIHDISQKRS